jgi:hypothetical protein
MFPDSQWPDLDLRVASSGQYPNFKLRHYKPPAYSPPFSASPEIGCGNNRKRDQGGYQRNKENPATLNLSQNGACCGESACGPSSRREPIGAGNEGPEQPHQDQDGD